MGAFWTYFRYMPMYLFIGGPLAIFTTYGIAVGKGHVYPFFPYISDTGTKPPESCIFSLCFSTSAFCVLCVVYIKYREISEFMKINPSVRVKPLWNKIGLGLGITSALSLNVVASFQELNEFTTHFLGAVLCFFSATFYFVLQTVFTFRMYPERRFLFYLRTSLTIINIVCIVGTFAVVHKAVTEFTGDNILQWTPDKGGYKYHITSTISEWFLVFSFICFMYSFFWDFRKFEMQPPVIKFKVHLAEHPTVQPIEQIIEHPPPDTHKPPPRPPAPSRDYTV